MRKNKSNIPKLLQRFKKKKMYSQVFKEKMDKLTALYLKKFF